MPDIAPSLVNKNRETDEDGVELGPRLVPVVGQDGVERLMPLPPITQIVIPPSTTKSSTIRWLYALGYPIKEIYVFLGVKYQMVRNITHNIPKRAAREDQPDLRVELKPETDDLMDALDGALEASLMAGRKERNKERRDALRANPDAVVEDEDEG